MPLNDFYTYKITSSDSNKIVAVITIDPKHAVYDGHFPDQPVTPGVILVEMVRSILSDQVGKKLMLNSAKELKFMSPVIPTDDITIVLSISFEVTDDGYKTACVFTSGEKTFTKLKGVFRAS